MPLPALWPAALPDRAIGLYVHWPFCQAKCPYCDFNSHVWDRVDQQRWALAYLSEIKRVSALAPAALLRSVYFGGGTPSLMPPDTVAQIVDAARAAWPTANDVEITLEANPTSTELDRFRAFRAAGVNRVSVGVQALNDADLRRLGRLHSAAEARTAFDIAARVFDRASFDLIYARQDQTLDAWRAELAEALSMGPSHLSLYQLTIEPGTAFGHRHARGGLRGLPGEDLGADLFDLTQDLCNAAGLPAYEVSNHARPGAESIHNLIYWQGGAYAAVGPGAHGRLADQNGWTATEALSDPRAWLNAVTAGTGQESTRRLPGPERAGEYLMMSLRLSEGMDRARHAAMGGAALNPEALGDLSELGLIRISATHIRATDHGRRVLNAVIRALLPD